MRATGRLLVAGPQWGRLCCVRGATLITSAFLFGPSVSTSATLGEGQARSSPRLAPQTNAGFIRQQSERKRAAEGISELRRQSGFTWDQLARLFKVSRRALHFWASGQPMSAEHEEQLHRVAACIRQAYCGTGEETRATLFRAGADGRIPFDLLMDGRYNEALAVVSGSSVLLPNSRPPLPSERAAEWKPENLVDALHDRVHAPGVQRSSTRVRTRVGRA
jgi:DNA-binding transcriptional regulator YiaG